MKHSPIPKNDYPADWDDEDQELDEKALTCRAF